MTMRSSWASGFTASRASAVNRSSRPTTWSTHLDHRDPRPTPRRLPATGSPCFRQQPGGDPDDGAADRRPAPPSPLIRVARDPGRPGLPRDLLSALEMAGVSLSGPPGRRREAGPSSTPRPRPRPGPTHASRPPACLGSRRAERGEGQRKKEGLTRRLGGTAADRARPRPEHAILAAMVALIDAGPTLTELDRVVGDGDLGLSLERGAPAAVREALGTTSYPLDDPAAAAASPRPDTAKALRVPRGPLRPGSSSPRSARLRDPHAQPTPRPGSTAFYTRHRRHRRASAVPGQGPATMLDASLPALDASRSGARMR